jgi:hypothetical protein
MRLLAQRRLLVPVPIQTANGSSVGGFWKSASRLRSIHHLPGLALGWTAKMAHLGHEGEGANHCTRTWVREGTLGHAASILGLATGPYPLVDSSSPHEWTGL